MCLLPRSSGPLLHGGSVLCAEGLELDSRPYELVDQRDYLNPTTHPPAGQLRAGIQTAAALDRMLWGGIYQQRLSAVHPPTRELLAQQCSVRKDSTVDLPREKPGACCRNIFQESTGHRLNCFPDWGGSQAACISPDQLHRSVHKSTASPPYQYVVDARLEPRKTF